MTNACHGLVSKGLIELRRLHCDLLELFKIVKRYTISDLFNCLSFNLNTNNHNTRGHCFKLNVTLCHKNVFKSFLTNRIVNICNNLHNDCFNSDLISSFKSKLLLIDFTNSLRGRLLAILPFACCFTLLELFLCMHVFSTNKVIIIIVIKIKCKKLLCKKI